MSFGCEHSCSSHRRVLNFNSKVAQGGGGGIYLHIKFKNDRLNIFRVRVFTSSRRTRTSITRLAHLGSDLSSLLY